MGVLDYNTSDGRFLFILPWENHTLIGTTDQMGPAETLPSPPEDDIEWLLTLTPMDIVLKGIQTGADAVMAKKMGVKGIVVSNHGGRQIDTARSGIEILPEVMEALNAEFSEEELDVLRGVKAVFDPVGLSNPGKVVPERGDVS